MTGAAEVLRERDDAVVVRAALDDRVDLDWEPGGRGGVDPVEHPLHGEVDVVQRAERRVVDGVEADRDAAQAGAGERLGLLRQQRAVRRQRELELPRISCSEQLDEVLDVPAHERLAAGDPHGAHAEAREDAGDAGELFELRSSLRSRKRGPGRRPPSACSRRSGSCSGR